MTKKPFTMKHLLLLALLGWLATSPVQAISLYKWVDENGRVHYSQTPPPDDAATQPEQVQVKEHNPYQSQPDEESNETKPTTTDAAASVVETRRKNCETAKQNMEIFKTSERVQQPDGTIITLSDEMRTSKIKEMQALINAYCN